MIGICLCIRKEKPDKLSANPRENQDIIMSAVREKIRLMQ